MSKIKELFILVFLFLLIAFSIAIYSSFSNKSSDYSIYPNRNYNQTIQIDERVFEVDVAMSPKERSLGLSGQTGLLENQGLLFIFSEPGFHSFWMKDMLFSIDIIWIGESMEVVHIERNVSPESYPKTFRPSQEALYVLELSAGSAERNNIEIGSKLSF